MCALVNYNIAEAEAAWTELSKVDGGRKGCVTSGEWVRIQACRTGFLHRMLL